MNQFKDQWHCCGSKFIQYDETAEHIKSQHLTQTISKKFKGLICCNQCAKASSNPRTMILHSISNHVQHFLQCDNCLQKYSGLAEYCGHMQTCKANWSDICAQENCSNKEGKNEPKEEVKLCKKCNGNHWIQDCQLGFLNKTPQERTKIIKELKSCFKCFTKHKPGNCQGDNCSKCGNSHHVLLCFKSEIKSHQRMTNWLRILKAFVAGR